MAKIVAVAGSYREHSYNRRVLNIAVDGARKAGADVTEIDLREFKLPIYCADDVEREGFHPEALRLQDVLNGHQGFLIASPEYNGSVPGGFKNLIDWASRANQAHKTYEVFKGKTAAIMTASTGQFGGLRCMAHLRGVFSIMGVNVLASEVAVTFADKKFEGDSLEINDAKTKALLEKLGASLASVLKD